MTKLDVDNAILCCEFTDFNGLVVHRICSLPCLTSNDPMDDLTLVISSLDVGMPARNLSPHNSSNRIVI